MVWFRKAAPAEPLAITMTGVKLGDRVLAIGLRDAALAAALAAKTGLTGRACAVDADAALVARAAAAIEQEGALADVTSAPWGALPYEAGAFDLVVVRDVMATIADDERRRLLVEIFRVLRGGGRIVVIETTPRGGIAGLLGGPKVDPSYASRGAVRALTDTGFAAARVLAERDGLRFIEAAKRAGV
jgi:demethylmenaquinone methyltransferase/2-methoxy-6-polyprenyl-1,4-benzoquinol methylase